MMMMMMMMDILFCIWNKNDDRHHFLHLDIHPHLSNQERFDSSAHRFRLLLVSMQSHHSTPHVSPGSTDYQIWGVAGPPEQIRRGDVFHLIRRLPRRRRRLSAQQVPSRLPLRLRRYITSLETVWLPLLSFSDLLRHFRRRIVDFVRSFSRCNYSLYFLFHSSNSFISI